MIKDDVDCLLYEMLYINCLNVQSDSGVVHTYPEICENANFFYEYGLRPHVSSVFSGRIRKFLKTLSCGRSYPEIFEYAFVILLDPVFTASIINKHGVQQAGL